MEPVIAVLAVAHCVAPAIAGTRGAYMNSAGYGRAVDAIVYSGLTNTASSLSMYYPCAAVNPQGGFNCNSGYTKGLPPGTPSMVYCQSKGAPNYIWSIQSYVTGGATADNPELEARVNVTPANCAAYTIESQEAQFTDAFSGKLIVNATATPGAAIWLRALEFMGSGVPESLEELLADSELRWDFVLPGPFTFSANDCTALTIPFTTKTGHANLYFVADGVAKSTPFTLTCPGNDDYVIFDCDNASPVYPPAQVSGGCGNVTVTYDPPADQLPAGVTPVTVTAMDEADNIIQCTFLAYRRVLAFHGFYSPLDGPSGSCESPLRKAKLGSTVPVKFDVKCDGMGFIEGQPTLAIQKCPYSTPVLSGNFQRVANEWHFNWDTSGQTKGVYKLIATLQDGTKREVFISLTK